MTPSFDGKVVAITGGAHGIGLATARTLSRLGARVAIGDVDTAALDGLSGLAGVRPVPLDVTDSTSMQDFVATVERHLGALDVFVNNAGILSAGRAVDQSDTVTRRVIDVNLIGTINGTKSALMVMLPRRRGHIVNVASISGESYGAGEASYCASKYGVVGYTDAVRFELHDTGIKLTLVMPTMVRTRLMSGVSELRGPRLLHKVDAEDVASAIASVIRRPRRRTYVPSGARVLMALNRATPAPISEPIAAMLGARSIFLDVDNAQRSEYEQELTTRASGARAPGGTRTHTPFGNGF